MLIIGSILPIQIKEALRTTGNHKFIHPALHIGCFVVLGVLGSSLARSSRQRVFNTTAVICFGLSLELLEAFYYQQELETRDVGLDACGAVTGLLSYFAVRCIRRRTQPSGKLEPKPEEVVD